MKRFASKIIFLIVSGVWITGCMEPPNYTPVIEFINYWPDTVYIHQTVTLICVAEDKFDGDVVTYTWGSFSGSFPDGVEGQTVLWRAPGQPGAYAVWVTVTDGKDEDVEYTEIPILIPPEAVVFPLGQTGEVIMMVRIRPGTYGIGSWSDDPTVETDELPRHEITIEQSVWIGKYEVTQSQWTAVTGENPSNHVDPDCPVENVSWEDIHDLFLDALNEEEEELWRLPSEAEWEYACRAFSPTLFPWGNDTQYELLGDYAWYSGNSAYTTHAVGQKQQVTWRLHDIFGNVWEWCRDHYHSSYENAPIDGSAWVDSTGTSRIVRGGSFNSSGKDCRTANRHYYTQTTRSDDIGFRAARD